MYGSVLKNIAIDL